MIWSACLLFCTRRLLAEFAYAVLPVLAEQTSTQLSVSLTSGLVAGVCAAIVSQPGETWPFAEYQGKISYIGSRAIDAVEPRELL